MMEDIYKKYYREVFLYAFSLCKNYHLAQDLTSDTFYKAYLTIGELDYIKYWLFRVCKNLFFDYTRKNKEYPQEHFEQSTMSTEENVLEQIIAIEEKRKLFDLIISMQENYREILILYYYCDFSIRDICHTKDISESTAKTMLYRARKKMRKELEGKHEF